MMRAYIHSKPDLSNELRNGPPGSKEHF